MNKDIKTKKQSIILKFSTENFKEHVSQNHW